MWTWFVMIATLPSNLFSAYLIKGEDATFTSLILALAPALAGIFMGIRPFMGKYFQPTSWTVWVSMAVVMSSVIFYKAVGLWRLRRSGGETQPLVKRPWEKTTVNNP